MASVGPPPTSMFTKRFVLFCKFMRRYLRRRCSPHCLVERCTQQLAVVSGEVDRSDALRVRPLKPPQTLPGLDLPHLHTQTTFILLKSTPTLSQQLLIPHTYTMYVSTKIQYPDVCVWTNACVDIKRPKHLHTPYRVCEKDKEKALHNQSIAMSIGLWYPPNALATPSLVSPAKHLCYGKRSVCGQKKRFKNTPMKTLTSFNIDVANWEACAQDRPLWRSMIHTGARRAEANRIAEAQKKRAARDFTLSPAPQPARYTLALSVEECCRPELDWLATSALEASL